MDAEAPPNGDNGTPTTTKIEPEPLDKSLYQLIVRQLESDGLKILAARLAEETKTSASVVGVFGFSEQLLYV